MTRQISGGRKAAYYIGMGLMVLGGLLFASVFLSFAIGFGDFDRFQNAAGTMLVRAPLGMALLFIGAIMRNVGARGLAGSGAVLDPEQARQDLEPYSRMVGGMAKDALDEADIDLDGDRPQEVIRIRCRACGELNEEDAKFCKECGRAL